MSDENGERPSLAALIGVAAVVTFVVMLPVMLPYAVIAAAVAAVGAAVVGIPFVIVALRLRWTRWWQGGLVGAVAAGISPGIGLLLLGLFHRISGPLLAASVLGAFRHPQPAMLMIGAATGISYWSVCIAVQRWWIAAVISIAVACGGEFGMFAYQAKIGRDRAQTWQRQHAYDSSLPASATLLSLRLTRVQASNEGDALFVGSSEPQCGLLIHSAALAQQIPVGADLWADVTQFSGGTFALVKLGDVTDQNQLAKVQMWNCKPWR